MIKITDEKILVTHQMMDDNGMIDCDLYGVPVDYRNLANGLRWMAELDEDDFIIIENYFLLKADPDYKEEIVIPKVDSIDLEYLQDGVPSRDRYRIIEVEIEGMSIRYQIQRRFPIWFGILYKWMDVDNEGNRYTFTMTTPINLFFPVSSIGEAKSHIKRWKARDRKKTKVVFEIEA